MQKGYLGKSNAERLKYEFNCIEEIAKTINNEQLNYLINRYKDLLNKFTENYSWKVSDKIANAKLPSYSELPKVK